MHHINFNNSLSPDADARDLHGQNRFIHVLLGRLEQSLDPFLQAPRHPLRHPHPRMEDASRHNEGIVPLREKHNKKYSFRGSSPSRLRPAQSN